MAATAAAPQTRSSELALIKKSVVDVVTDKVREFTEKKQLLLPANYSVENAMKSAWLTLQMTTNKDGRPVLATCTRDSIANALLDMVVQGLNPAKKQCYFIAYGDKLVCQRSYFGTIHVVKQVAGARDVYAECVYKGDDFEYVLENGHRRIVKHVQRIENVKPDNIVAAYAVIVFGDERPDYVEIMTIDQIRQAWAKSRNNPNDPKSVHSQFPDQMAMRTVINRACKRYINTSNDDHLFQEHFNRADEIAAEAEFEEELAANANGEVIDIEPAAADDDAGEEAQADPEAGPEREPEPELAPAPQTTAQTPQRSARPQQRQATLLDDEEAPY
ncbi:recombinase RecT [Symbiobacterium terraclitae]|uniref:recombinase RecT n=1 Tax=Symbiobacterium terraclitae TaxID=557451 RepID=UPI0035B56EA6